ncbi:hypothetical protein [Maritalea porphyrae]|uniref:Uncharacterized protein n=1 Tax=Maritalea porphyrae TaxID=880732 RepID=A0ABQ5UWB2_9HYPH|nr:hypothetical protein [Maritalea porphyrae]GLQ18277.1 hypothetical protein GCM10007879_25260 [Maritalea porphyrae]
MRWGRAYFASQKQKHVEKWELFNQLLRLAASSQSAMMHMGLTLIFTRRHLRCATMYFPEGAA